MHPCVDGACSVRRDDGNNGVLCTEYRCLSVRRESSPFLTWSCGSPHSYICSLRDAANPGVKYPRLQWLSNEPSLLRWLLGMPILHRKTAIGIRGICNRYPSEMGADLGRILHMPVQHFTFPFMHRTQCRRIRNNVS